MTHKTGSEHQPRKSAPETKQPHAPFSFNVRSKKNKALPRELSRGHRNWTFNRRISG